jgi:hypothetical protein
MSADAVMSAESDMDFFGMYWKPGGQGAQKVAPSPDTVPLGHLKHSFEPAYEE